MYKRRHKKIKTILYLNLKRSKFSNQFPRSIYTIQNIDEIQDNFIVNLNKRFDVKKISFF